jgi:hypothetical protein
MNLFVAAQFRFQDPNAAACTATSVRSMLNFIAVHRTGGPGFRWWRPNTWGSTRDHILAWERTHDTMTGGTGADACCVTVTNGKTSQAMTEGMR